MANIPLKTIKFPGLANTYTIPEVSTDLTASGKAAEAAKVGAELATLGDQLDTNTEDIDKLKADLDDVSADIFGGNASQFTWEDGFIYNATVSTNASFQKTKGITLHRGDVISFTGGKGTSALPVNAVSQFVNNGYKQLIAYSGSIAESISYTATDEMVVVISTKKDAYGVDLKVARNGAVPEYIITDTEALEITGINNANYVYNFVDGETYFVKNESSGSVTLQTRETTTSPTIDTVLILAGNTNSFVATSNAYYFKFLGSGKISIWDSKTLLKFIERTNSFEKEFGNYGDAIPLVHFKFSSDMFSFTDELDGVNFTDNNGSWFSMPETIYNKFDDLAEDYSSYITKVDAAQDVSLSYPTYANLNGEASGDYSATPTYKTYLYKLIDTNNCVYSSARNKKKKLLLIGGTHGSEIAAPFNLYLLAKKLCESTDEDYFKLRSAFDIYILPCLNGYGMYHMLRVNANGVNINRNYPIKNFAVSGEGTQEYTGETANSEFETQIVTALQAKYKFDVAVDHHNYGVSETQFYTICWDDRLRPIVNSALNDCCFSFIKNKPTYFGTAHKLFIDIANVSFPNLDLTGNLTQPTASHWFSEQDTDFSATIEISYNINYLGGELNASSNNPRYTNDVFAVGEFTLRNQLLHYCGYVLGNAVG